MRGDLQAIGSRLVVTITRPGWLASLKHDRRRSKEHELEVIERVTRLERNARRSGAYAPKVGPRP